MIPVPMVIWRYLEMQEAIGITLVYGLYREAREAIAAVDIRT